MKIILGNRQVMQHSNFQFLSKRNKAQRDVCLKSTEVKEVDIYVLDEKGLVTLWVSEQKKEASPIRKLMKKLSL